MTISTEDCCAPALGPWVVGLERVRVDVPCDRVWSLRDGFLLLWPPGSDCGLYCLVEVSTVIVSSSSLRDFGISSIAWGSGFRGVRVRREPCLP